MALAIGQHHRGARPPKNSMNCNMTLACSHYLCWASPRTKPLDVFEIATHYVTLQTCDRSSTTHASPCAEKNATASCTGDCRGQSHSEAAVLQLRDSARPSPRRSSGSRRPARAILYKSICCLMFSMCFLSSSALGLVRER